MTPNQAYRAAIYFAVATMYFYRDSIVGIVPGQTLGDFAELNRAVIDKVMAEAKQYINYELSHEQIRRAIQAYLAPPAALTAQP